MSKKTTAETGADSSETNADETGADTLEEGVPAFVPITTVNDEPGFIDADTVTHLHAAKGHSKGGSFIGTTGGLVIHVLQDFEELARAFGWI